MLDLTKFLEIVNSRDTHNKFSIFWFCARDILNQFENTHASPPGFETFKFYIFLHKYPNNLC